ncbi:MAG: thiolase family protein [Gammaproteobacteria bacterium]
MQQNAYIAGIGMTPFGKHMDRTLKSLAVEAVEQALKDADIEKDQLQAAYVGTAGTAVTVGQVMVPGQAALRSMGIGHIPVINVENACASAATSFQQACTMVSHGVYDIVLAVGMEKLYCEDKGKTFSVFTGAVDFESFEEVTEKVYDRIREAGIEVDGDAGESRSLFMDIYAAWAIEHMREYGTTQRDFAAVSAKNTFHGSLNPNAQYRNVMTEDEVLAAREISYPLTLAMCSPIGDGAAAAVLVSEKMARQLGMERMVKVRASLLRSGWDYDQSEAGVAEVVAKETYELSGLGPKDLDVIELHDASSPAELMYYEYLGLCEKGEGAKLVSDGATKLGGSIPVNPSGGLLRKGHPVGATGLAQVHELVTQLRGEAGPRQVEGARIGLAENGGGYIGSDAAALVISILEK